MIVAHVGPPPRRIGGPAGYLHQLQTGASTDAHPRHDVRFPASERIPPSRQPPSPSPPGLLTRMRRKVFGPKFYRPSSSELARAGGLVDGMLRTTATDIKDEAGASLAAALDDADVIFTHEPFSADAALSRRHPGQQVWMMCHGVTPMALYSVWSWGVPEADWQSLVDYPDVRTWTDWELDIWTRVDRLVLPCPEAGESFRTIDARFNAMIDRASFVLSGASAPARGSGSNPLGESNGERVGLYLGSGEPYRGFDVLVKAVKMVPADVKLAIAVAGPPADKVPAHPCFRALGRVEDVAALLHSIDFLINVNRFTLFDLSTIEATQAGKPLLLHAVGGNRAFERLGAGCVMLPDLEPSTVARGLTALATLDSASLAALAERSQSCWKQHLTPRHMWDRHLTLYDEVS